ncbi:hypothetical protein Tco_1169836 [Tanacetum coccineum]
MAATKAIKYAPQCGDLTIEFVVFHKNNFVGNFKYPQSASAYKLICKFLMNCPLAEAFTKTPKVLYPNFLKEFWCTAIAYEPNPLADNFEARPLKEYKIKTYVSHPSPEDVKAELTKINYNPILLDRTPVLKTTFLMA